MAKQKLMCDLIAELIGEMRNDEENATFPYVYEKVDANTIKVFVELPEQGIDRYTINVKDVTVKEVYKNYLENDLVDLASVEGINDQNHQLVCAGSLFHVFAGGCDPERDRLSNYETMDFFRWALKRAIRISLCLADE